MPNYNGYSADSLQTQPFLGEHFLLENEFAEHLYHEYAAPQPIIDYHCHLSPEDINNNRQFTSLTEAWLEGDHYKWRAMRTHGISEHFITGKASDWEKFEQWSATVPYTLRNPLYHWTHLELQRYFDIDTVLNTRTAKEIYFEANTRLAVPDLSTQGILRKMNVEVVCTTDDPCDALEAHRQYAQMATTSGPSTKVLPTFRPDKSILIEKPGFLAYVAQLGQAANVQINSWDALLHALEQRMDFFHEMGCRLSDHGLERLSSAPFTESVVQQIFKKRMAGNQLDASEVETYKSALLYWLGTGYHQRGWTQQYHLGALRNNNDRMMLKLGPDTGFDSIGDFDQARSLAGFLNRLDSTDQLAQTILYNLNPRDNEVFATMIGNFNDGSVAGKIQWGSAWWFLDQKDGMEKQLNALSNLGILAQFVGMLTDSRSFLSFPRHEYFRRILCNLIGRDVAKGELPNDLPWLGNVVEDICYRNAKKYFRF